MTRTNRLLAIAGAVVGGAIILFFAGRTVQNSLQFSVASTVPSGVFPTSSSDITVQFNRELKGLADQPANVVSITPELAHRLEINGKALTITLTTEPAKDSTFTVSLNDLMSIDGDTLDTQLDYSVEFVPFNRLPASIREQQSAKTGTPSERHPLLSKLPYDEIFYRITFNADPETFGTASTWQEEKDNFSVIISTFASRADGASDEQFVADTLTIRDLALEWIREQGVNPDTDINIEFFPSDEELSNEEEFTQ